MERVSGVVRTGATTVDGVVPPFGPGEGEGDGKGDGVERGLWAVLKVQVPELVQEQPREWEQGSVL